MMETRVWAWLIYTDEVSVAFRIMEGIDVIVISDSESESDEYWTWIDNMQHLLQNEALQELNVTDVVEILDSEPGELVTSNDC